MYLCNKAYPSDSQTEDGETPDTLSEDVLYEVHMTVEDGGDFDLSETEKEIKISAVLGI